MIRDDYEEAKHVGFEIARQDRRNYEIDTTVIRTPVFTREELKEADLTREDLHSASINGFLVGQYSTHAFSARSKDKNVIIKHEVLSMHDRKIKKWNIINGLDG